MEVKVEVKMEVKMEVEVKVEVKMEVKMEVIEGQYNMGRQHPNLSSSTQTLSNSPLKGEKSLPFKGRYRGVFPFNSIL